MTQPDSSIPRPATITAIGWLFILVGAVGLLNDLWPLLTPDAARQVAKLKADGLADLGPAWVSRLLVVVGGAGLLRGRNWARWLLVAWMIFHVGLSLFHTLTELLIHVRIFTPVLILLFRSASDSWLNAGAPGHCPPPGTTS